MKLFLLLLLFLPALVYARQEDKSDDDNSLPTGILTRENILSLELYNQRYQSYVPKTEPVEAIRMTEGPVEIKVVFGDWCKDSKKHIPAFIKTMETANNKNLLITYINVDRQKKEPADLLEGLNVESVPTFIVSKDGNELGRVIETPKASMEQDIAAILGYESH